MGLDMMLYKQSYVGMKYDWVQEKNTARLSGPDLDHIKVDRIAFITEEVACWRKANAIHRWFVEQDPTQKDNCQEIFVTRADLMDLRRLCKEVLEGVRTEENAEWLHRDGKWIEGAETVKVVLNPKFCEERLPTQPGFFFGSTEYDEIYLETLEYTKDTLDKVLKEGSEGGYYYQASW